MFLHGLGEKINSTSGVDDLDVTVTQHFHKYIVQLFFSSVILLDLFTEKQNRIV